MAFQHDPCRHPAGNRSGSLCLSCVSDRLRDETGLPIQRQRILEGLHDHLAGSFPALSSKARRHFWAVLLPGIVAAVRQHSDHLPTAHALMTEHFHAKEILSFVMRSLVFNVDATSTAARFVAQVLSFAAQKEPDASVQLLEDERVRRWVVDSCSSGNEATTEAGLYCAWVLLGNEWENHQQRAAKGGGGREEALDDDDDDDDAGGADLPRFNFAVRSALSDLNRLCALLETRVPAQLRMNLLGVLARLVLQRSKDDDGSVGGGDELVDTIIGGERPPALRRLLLCMVQVRTPCRAIPFTLACLPAVLPLCSDSSRPFASTASRLQCCRSTQSWLRRRRCC